VYQTVIARRLNGGGIRKNFSMLVFDADNWTFVSNPACEGNYLPIYRGESVIDLIFLYLSNPTGEMDVTVAKVFKDEGADLVWQYLEWGESGGSSFWDSLSDCWRSSLVRS
jgi:hypothetical protein